MKLKYKNKHYCVSQCAKDKFEQYILTPIAIFLAALIFTIIFLVITSILGFITEGILVTFFDANAMIKDGLWITVGAAELVAIGISIIIYIAVKETYYKIHRYIEYRLSNAYTKQYKPECKLFIECNE